ncbi:hypothetical protein [Palleronia sp.]|uniref:hypothetical protein n=1 Tax=Palleronia sp. TaxID=1940284 RepID=UPI0035C84372
MIRPLALLVALASPAAAQPPDWCGASGLNTAERTICTTPALQWRDRAVNRLWEQMDGRAGITLNRDNWLGSRNACGDNVACLVDSYDDRIFELRTLVGVGDGPRLRPWCGASGLSTTEATICTTPRLADYDAALQHLSDSLGAPGNAEWLADRDSCGADVACIENAYLDRFATLGQVARTQE